VSDVDDTVLDLDLRLGLGRCLGLGCSNDLETASSRCRCRITTLRLVVLDMTCISRIIHVARCTIFRRSSLHQVLCEKGLFGAGLYPFWTDPNYPAVL